MLCFPGGSVGKESACDAGDPGSIPGLGRALEWDCHFFLQGIFPTQGSNLGVLHCRQILYHLSHQGSPMKITSMPKYHQEALLLGPSQGSLHPLGSLPHPPARVGSSQALPVRDLTAAGPRQVPSLCLKVK